MTSSWLPRDAFETRNQTIQKDHQPAQSTRKHRLVGRGMFLQETPGRNPLGSSNGAGDGHPTA